MKSRKIMMWTGKVAKNRDINANRKDAIAEKMQRTDDIIHKYNYTEY